MYHGQVVPGLSAAPAPRLRDGHHRAPRLDRSLRLAGRGRALRPRRRAVADSGRRHRALGDVPAASIASSPNPLELFQIWLNLPKSDKLVDPYFTMFWDGDIPRRSFTDEAGRKTDVTVIAGGLDGAAPLAPPPSSWASRRGRGRGDLVRAHGRGRGLDHAAGEGRHRAHALLLQRTDHEDRRALRSEARGGLAEGVMSRCGSKRATASASYCCCRRAPSRSPWCSTARS